MGEQRSLMLAIVSCFSSPESGKVKTVIEAMLIEGKITTPFIEGVLHARHRERPFTCVLESSVPSDGGCGSESYMTCLVLRAGGRASIWTQDSKAHFLSSRLCDPFAKTPKADQGAFERVPRGKARDQTRLP